MLHVLRHGETQWNVAGRSQGRLDSPLTAKGERQADALGRALAESLGAAAAPLKTYVSPLGRAQRTADLASVHLTLDRIIEPRLAEVDMGAWDGKTMLEIEAEYPGAMAGTTTFDWCFRGPGGETFEVMIDRVTRWLNDLDGGPAAAICHGVTSRLVRGVYLGLTKEYMLALPIPQDGFFTLNGGFETYVPAETRL